MLKTVRAKLQSYKRHVGRIHSLKAEVCAIAVEVRILDQVLDGLDNLHVDW